MIKSKKKKAIEAMERALHQLDDVNNHNSAWVTNVSDLFRIYFGEKSEFYLNMRNFAFNSVYGGKIDSAPQRAKQMLLDAIFQVKNHGVYKENKGEHWFWKILNLIKFWGK